MDINSTQFTAAMLSFFSTFLVTQVIGRFIDHNYDRLFKELDKNLKIKNAMPEDMHSESFDQLIRKQLNSYILMRSQETVGKKVMHKAFLLIIAGITAVLLTFSINFIMDGRIWLSVLSTIATLAAGSYYFERRQAWTKRGFVENTKYKALFKGGTFSGGQTTIDIIQSDSSENQPIDYPKIAIVDDAANKLHIYNRFKSAGALTIATGDDTTLVTEYEYEGTTTINGENLPHHTKDRALIDVSDIKTSGVYYPVTAEMPLIARPIQEAVRGSKKVIKLFSK